MVDPVAAPVGGVLVVDAPAVEAPALMPVVFPAVVVPGVLIPVVVDPDVVLCDPIPVVVEGVELVVPDIEPAEVVPPEVVVAVVVPAASAVVEGEVVLAVVDCIDPAEEAVEPVVGAGAGVPVAAVSSLEPLPQPMARAASAARKLNLAIFIMRLPVGPQASLLGRRGVGQGSHQSRCFYRSRSSFRKPQGEFLPLSILYK